MLSAIKYIVDIISPGNSFKNRLEELLMENHKLLTIKEMGFPADWKELPDWKM
jgi:abortive infection bacteriophage resistance protein